MMSEAILCNPEKSTTVCTLLIPLQQNENLSTYYIKKEAFQRTNNQFQLQYSHINRINKVSERRHLHNDGDDIVSYENFIAWYNIGEMLVRIEQ